MKVDGGFVKFKENHQPKAQASKEEIAAVDPEA